MPLSGVLEPQTDFECDSSAFGRLITSDSPGPPECVASTTSTDRGSTHNFIRSQLSPNGVALRKPEPSASTDKIINGTVINKPDSCGP